MSIVTQNTLLLELETGQYPVRLYNVRKDPKIRNTVMIPPEPTEDQLLSLGYVVVEAVERPEGDVVTEGTPIQATESTVIPGVDVIVGKYYQTWEVRSYNEEEISQLVANKKTSLLADLKSGAERVFYKGAPYTFAGDVVNHIQLRDGDRANLAGLRSGADADLRKLQENPEFTPRTSGFRTFENNFFPMTPQELLDFTDYALGAYMAMKGTQWTYEAMIQASTSLAELNSFNIEEIKTEIYESQVV